jgi:hypothetical protein
MARSASSIARGAVEKLTPSTNLTVIRGRLVAAPTVRVIDRRQRATTFDLATMVNGRRLVVPVVALDSDLPAVKVGDELCVVGYVRRRFFRTGTRTQSVTEVVVEHLSAGGRGMRIDRLFAIAGDRTRSMRSATVPVVR